MFRNASWPLLFFGLIGIGVPTLAKPKDGFETFHLTQTLVSSVCSTSTAQSSLQCQFEALTSNLDQQIVLSEADDQSLSGALYRTYQVGVYNLTLVIHVRKVSAAEPTVSKYEVSAYGYVGSAQHPDQAEFLNFGDCQFRDPTLLDSVSWTGQSFDFGPDRVGFSLEFSFGKSPALQKSSSQVN